MRRIFLDAIAVAVLTALIGYTSAVGSRRSCEAAASARIRRELGGHPVFVLSDAATGAYSYSGAASILQRNGLKTMRCVRSGDAFDCFPWAGVSRALVVAPFLVKVEWGFVAAPLSGYGTRTLYLAIFGAVFELRDGPGWVTKPSLPNGPQQPTSGVARASCFEIAVNAAAGERQDVRS